MPVFFQGSPGRTVRLDDPAAAGSVAMVGVNPQFDWNSSRVIVTRLVVAHQANFQFLHTIGNDVYVYVFGDRVGSVTLSGLAVAADCDSGDPSHGMEQAMAWYASNKVSARQAPVRIAVGVRTAFDAFVIGSNYDVVDPGSRLASFSLNLAVIPDKA